MPPKQRVLKLKQRDIRDQATRLILNFLCRANSKPSFRRRNPSRAISTTAESEVQVSIPFHRVGSDSLGSSWDAPKANKKVGGSWRRLQADGSP